MARSVKEVSPVVDGTIQPLAGDVPHPVVTLEQVQSALEVALIGIREVALNGGHSGLTPSDRLQGYSFWECDLLIREEQAHHWDEQVQLRSWWPRSNASRRSSTLFRSTTLVNGTSN
jgi:hypothetical protein